MKVYGRSLSVGNLKHKTVFSSGCQSLIIFCEGESFIEKKGGDLSVLFQTSLSLAID